MKNIKLYNSVEVPVLGIGTFMISPDDTERSVYSALKTGYRMIDTANAYMNEEAVGKGLKKAIAEGIVNFPVLDLTMLICFSSISLRAIILQATS